MAFVLAAMVAVPERHVPAHVVVGVEDGDVTSRARRAATSATWAAENRLLPGSSVLVVVGQGDPRSHRLIALGRPGALDGAGATRRAPSVVAHPEWCYRDAGPHVLLDGLWQWLTQ